MAGNVADWAAAIRASATPPPKTTPTTPQRRKVPRVNSQWSIRREGSLIRCVSLANGEIFYDRCEQCWTKTRLYLFQRVGAVLEAMAASGAEVKGSFVTGEFRIDEIRPGQFWATQIETAELITWIEGDRSALSSCGTAGTRPRGSFRDTQIAKLMELAEEVKAALFPMESDPETPSISVSYPHLEGWLTYGVGGRGDHVQWRDAWFSSGKKHGHLLSVYDVDRSKGKRLIAEFDLHEVVSVKTRHVGDRCAFLLEFSCRNPLRLVAVGRENSEKWLSGLTAIFGTPQPPARIKPLPKKP